MVLVLLFAVALDHIFFSNASTETQHVYQVDHSAVPEVGAAAWGIYDARTGERLRVKNEHIPLPIASLTKLMTAYVVMETLDLSTSTLISRYAVETEGRAGKLEAGERLRVRELLFPLLLESSNDAAVVLAEHAGETPFLDAMHMQSRVLELYDTEFVDPSGLGEGNQSTIRDIAQFLVHLMAHNRHILDMTRLPQYVGENNTWYNNSPVVSTTGYLGGKHGFTDEAGRTLAAVFEEALEGGVEKEIIFIVFDSADVLSDIESLRNYVRNYVSYR